MSAATPEELAEALERLRDPSRSWEEAESILLGLLRPLLERDGYLLEVDHSGRGPDDGLDVRAVRPASVDHREQKLGVTFKFRRDERPISVSNVHELIGASVIQGLDRALLVCNTRFTKAAIDAVNKDFPVDVELIDPEVLKSWTLSDEDDPPPAHLEVARLIRDVSRQLALLVARDPTALDELEWRDLERLVAEIFDGLGFKATLTPASKDGGKDVIVECFVQGRKASYVVEIKHWRSGKRVGGADTRNLLEVIGREHRDGGLFLSTYGYSKTAFAQLSSVERQKLRFGDKAKIVALCRTYSKARSGILSPPKQLAEVLYEGTV
jgi:HJR/Mrr/RecB family endonuclease